MHISRQLFQGETLFASFQLFAWEIIPDLDTPFPCVGWHLCSDLSKLKFIFQNAELIFFHLFFKLENL